MKAGLIATLVAVVVLGGLAAACGGSDADAGSAGNSSAGVEQLAAALQSNGTGAAGISVSGTGVAVAVPDMATLSLGVSTLRDSARQARDDAASLTNDLIATLEENGIAEDDYHTSQFSIDPQYDYTRDGEQVLRGYRVTNMLSVKVRDLDRVGEVIDDAVDAVGDPIRVQGVGFSIDDVSAVQSEARAQAMADAETKAGELADLAGVAVGKPIAISESSGGGQPPIFFEAAGADLAAETPIEPGQLEVTVTVQVTYAIS